MNVENSCNKVNLCSLAARKNISMVLMVQLQLGGLFELGELKS